MARRLVISIAVLAVALVAAAPAAARSSLAGGVRAPGGYNGVTGGVAVGTPSPGGVRQISPGSGARDIPRGYLRLYRSAARAYGVDWRVLAAIGKIESDHGRSQAAGVHSGLNFADCCSGPMQICTVKACGRVWRSYGVDGDGDGLASVYDPNDAVYGAAWIVRDIQALFGRNHPGLILAAYNAGPAAVQKFRGVPRYRETRAYVASGLRYMRLLRR